MVEQKTRFSNRELEHLKNTFAEKDDLLFAIRKTLLQLELKESEDMLLKSTMNEDLLKLMYKFFLPELDGDAPLHQIADMWMVNDIKDKMPEEANLSIESRQLFIKYMGQQLRCLNNSIENYYRFKDMLPEKNKDVTERYIKLTARNLIIAHVEQQLFQIKLLAGQKNETPEETLKRLQQDSAK